jgi:glycerol-3-phosphate dehydrogenase
MGIHAYDFLAGFESIGKSYYMSKAKSLEAFPMMEPSKVLGALVYYGERLVDWLVISYLRRLDGQHDDSRMNISLATTAAMYGATVANYVNIVQLEKDEDGRLIGARAEDVISKKNGQDARDFSIRAKV